MYKIMYMHDVKAIKLWNAQEGERFERGQINTPC